MAVWGEEESGGTKSLVDAGRMPMMGWERLLKRAGGSEGGHPYVPQGTHYSSSPHPPLPGLRLGLHRPGETWTWGQ